MKIEPEQCKTCKLHMCPVKAQVFVYLLSLIGVFTGHIKDNIGPNTASSKDWSDWVDGQANLSLCWTCACNCVGFDVSWLKIEPPHDKTYKMACAPSGDSSQPGHPPSLIRVFAVRMKKHWVLSYPLSTLRRSWSDWADAQLTWVFAGGWSESLLGAQIILLVLSWGSSDGFFLHIIAVIVI